MPGKLTRGGSLGGDLSKEFSGVGLPTPRRGSGCPSNFSQTTRSSGCHVRGTVFASALFGFGMSYKSRVSSDCLLRAPAFNCCQCPLLYLGKCFDPLRGYCRILYIGFPIGINFVKFFIVLPCPATEISIHQGWFKLDS